MSYIQYARGLFAKFTGFSNPFAAGNGMDENLRLLDDHIGLYTLFVPQAVGTPKPVSPDDGDGVLYVDGSYATFNGSVWKTYAPRPGVKAMMADGSDVWLSTAAGGWLSMRMHAALDVALLPGKVFAATAVGIAAVDDGDYFTVPSAVSTEFVILYRRQGTVATEIKRYPTAEAMYAARDATAGSAAAAVGSAGAAATSLRDLQAALHDFNGRYYGVAAADPFLDPWGGPCKPGDIYFNLISNAAKVFSASVWSLVPGATAADIANAIDRAKGSGIVGHLPEGAGSVGTSVQKKLDEIPALTDKGGVADYAGMPLYDGADAGRITATDNTAAFNALVNTAIARGHSAVKVPAGHWAIKAGNLSFLAFNKLRIFGDGMDVTILDFIKEDNTHAGYVDNITAQCIAKFDTGNMLEFSDMTIKATTKCGLVNGAAGSNRVYEGAVWGFKIKDVKDIRFTRVRAEHFNYRGFSVYGAATERVTMLHCEGFYNASSGFWVENAAVFKVIGGEYAFNGIFGETGTGYGVTASSGIGKFIVKNPYCHHNYRKGIDSHGCAEFIVRDGTFENNVLFHIANPNWNPPAGVTDCGVIITGNTFSNGKLPADKAWMKSCYDALAVNGYNTSGALVVVNDTDQAGVATNKIKTVVFADNKIICHYNGIGDTASNLNGPFMDIYTPVADLTFKNNRVNLEHAAFVNGSNVYAHIGISLRAATVRLADNEIKFLQATQYTNATTGLTDWGSLFEFNNTVSPLTLEMFNNRFELNDAFFMTSTGVGARIPVGWTVAGSKRVVKSNVFSFLSDNFKGFNGLNDAYFLGRSDPSQVPLYQENNTFVRNGINWVMPKGGLGKTVSDATYQLYGLSKAINDEVMAIILDKQYHTSIRISTSDGSPDLVIDVPFSSYAGVTGSTGNTRLAYSSTDAAYVEGSVTKLKITVKAKVALSGDYYGRIAVDGSNASLGLERVIQL